MVTFNPSKVDATEPTFVPSTYQTPPTTTAPTRGYPTLYHETFGNNREIYPAVHKTTHKHQGTYPNHREAPQENHLNHQKTHPNHQEEYSGPHHGYRHQPATHQEPKYHEIQLPQEETRGSGGADDAARPDYFSSFSENVNHIREEYDSQKEERATFAPSAAENAPLAPAVNSGPAPVAAPGGSLQNSNSGKGKGGYPQKLKKVMRKKRFRPHHPRQQHDFSLAGIGSTLDSAIDSAIGSVGKFFGGVTRSTNNLQFEKFPVPFIPSATLQPEGKQQKRETIANPKQKDDSGKQTPPPPPGKDAAPLQDYSGLVDPRVKATPSDIAATVPPQSTSSYLSNEPLRPTPTLNFIPNENSGKANSHKKKTPPPAAAGAGPITYAPYRRKTPGFVRDVVAKYSYIMSLLGK